MKKNYDFRTSLAFNIISAIVILLLLFSVIVSVIGFATFTRTYKKAYSTSTYHIAETAAALVNGDSIERYLKEGKDEEYEQSAKYLDVYCQKAWVSLVYVIAVDQSDYGHFVSVFNSVNNEVDDSEYVPWELGYERETTNEEYAQKYEKLYSNNYESDNEKYETVYRTRNLGKYHPHITTLVPIENSKGEVTALLCVQRPMKELKRGAVPFLLKIGASAILLALVASALLAYFIKKFFVTPIRAVSDEATRFAKENTIAKEPLGEISKMDEISSLAHSIDKMEADMISYIENLTKFTAEKERIGAELSAAKTIQESSIPNNFPAFPDRSDFDIFASMEPAKEVGGDFYNFFLIDDNRLAIVIGDVSDKGIPAALFMMVTNILIIDRMHMTQSPAKALSVINQGICKRNEADMFITVWLGVLDLTTGKLTAVNAGHDDAVVCRKDGSCELFKSPHGLVVGAMQDIEYKDFEIDLEKGDKIFIYTDGVPEATNADNKMFGVDRMISAINEKKDGSPEDMLKIVRQRVDEFVDGAPQFDDLTMLCLEYKGREESNTLTVDAKGQNMQRVIEFVDSYLDKHDCSERTKMHLDLAVEEIFVNIANYAYKGREGKASITVDEQDGYISITFEDNGVPYDPLKKPDPDITLSAQDRQIGGLGIYLVKKNMDEVEYKYENNKNILTITKKI